MLTYHVVPGKVMAADVVKLKEAETVQGGKLAVKVDDKGVMINDARVREGRHRVRQRRDPCH